jgi:nitrite reductase/ring-hydroxylating ferredoxin subunit/uncharacterized membrane protein
LVIARFLTRIVYAQAGWARPFGDFNKRWIGAIFRPIRPIQDFLNGKWLGHSLHAVLTDVPIGVLTLVIVFDALDLRSAADITLAFGILAMLGAAAAGTADYSDTDDDALMLATVHATLMVTALLIYVVSFVLRLGNPVDRTVVIVLSLIGYVIVASSAWIGGEVAYGLGNMVNRHAWRFGNKSSWAKLDVTDIPENTPTAAKAGAQSLVVVRQGTTVYALHSVCAHAGGPLAEGKIVDGCIECPWHASRFELSTGYRKQGPTTWDQPRYEVRAADGGGWEARRVIPNRAQTEASGQNA